MQNKINKRPAQQPVLLYVIAAHILHTLIILNQLYHPECRIAPSPQSSPIGRAHLYVIANHPRHCEEDRVRRSNPEQRDPDTI